MSKTTTHRVTYLGRRAEVTETRYAGAKGLREVRVRWIDSATEANGSYPAGTVVRRLVKGDVRDGTFQVIEGPEVVS